MALQPSVAQARGGRTRWGRVSSIADAGSPKPAASGGAGGPAAPQRLLGVAALCRSRRRGPAWAGGEPRPGSLQPAAPSASVTAGLSSKSPWQELENAFFPSVTR